MKMKTYGFLLALTIALVSLGGCTQDTTTPPPSDSSAQDDLTVNHRWCDPTVETCVLPGVVSDDMLHPLLYKWRGTTDNDGCIGECDPCGGVHDDFTLCDFTHNGDVVALVRAAEPLTYRPVYCGEPNEFLAPVTLAPVEVLLVFGQEALPSKLTMLRGPATLGDSPPHWNTDRPTALVSLRKLDEGWVVARQVEAAFEAPAYWAQAPDNRCQTLALSADVDVIQGEYSSIQSAPATVCGHRATNAEFTQLMWGPAPDHYGCTPRPASKPADSPSPVVPGGLEVDGE